MFHRRTDAERFSQWVSDHGRAVRGFLLALVRRPDAADDLTQETFRKAWQAREAYHEQGTPRAYLLRIADRLAVDWSRRSRPEQNLNGDDWAQLEPAADDCPQQEYAKSEEIRQLHAALDQLSPVQRRVLLLRYYGDMSFQEIAETLKCPMNTTLSHCHRALNALRKLLADKIGIDL